MLFPNHSITPKHMTHLAMERGNSESEKEKSYSVALDIVTAVARKISIFWTTIALSSVKVSR
jgi:hypothetical protein